jgi:hypothetical protein
MKIELMKLDMVELETLIEHLYEVELLLLIQSTQQHCQIEFLLLIEAM